jgi:DNA-binding CsgD family transcriptional regulator
MADVRFGGRNGLPEATVLHDHGWSAPRHRSYWYEQFIHNQGFMQCHSFQKFAALPGALVTRTREQLVDDSDWYRSVEFQEKNRLLELDDLLASVLRWNHPHRLFVFTQVRPLREKKFSARERRLTHLFVDELSRYVGTALSLEVGGAFDQLPPRVRQTLDCLLEGDSEKLVAARLGLSQHTVHQYVKDLYRRLGVSSRAELLALCLKRRPKK